ncbi:hypothetical protein EBZ02_07030 [bacterium]|nr:hypothetical protein [bacterium]
MTPKPKTLSRLLVSAKANPWLAESPLADQDNPMNRFRFLSAILLPVLLVSCSQTPPGSDAEDERNPFFRQATKDVADLNYPAAIKQFEKAISVNPNVAKAYLQIGLLYGDKLGDPISAIYFYQKYLEARPNAAEREEVLAAMEKAKIDFALSLTNTGIQNAAEIARISKENVDLKPWFPPPLPPRKEKRRKPPLGLKPPAPCPRCLPPLHPLPRPKPLSPLPELSSIPSPRATLSGSWPNNTTQPRST